MFKQTKFGRHPVFGLEQELCQFEPLPNPTKLTRRPVFHPIGELCQSLKPHGAAANTPADHLTR